MEPISKKKNKYLLNAKQAGEALELLTNLEPNSVDLVFLDPQYEPARNILPTNYHLCIKALAFALL